MSACPSAQCTNSGRREVVPELTEGLGADVVNPRRWILGSPVFCVIEDSGPPTPNLLLTSGGVSVRVVYESMWDMNPLLCQFGPETRAYIWKVTYLFFGVSHTFQLIRSMVIAEAPPPPLQIDAIPIVASFCFRTFASERIILAPDAPIGCPRATPPPLTLI